MASPGRWRTPSATGGQITAAGNAVVPATDALTLGIVVHVVADTEVETTVLDETATLTRAARQALVGTKGREGLAAFLNRRQPHFQTKTSRR